MSTKMPLRKIKKTGQGDFCVLCGRVLSLYCGYIYKKEVCVRVYLLHVHVATLLTSKDLWDVSVRALSQRYICRTYCVNVVCVCICVLVSLSVSLAVCVPGCMCVCVCV